MTISQLKKTQQSYLAEFDRAVNRRRQALQKFFKYQINELKKLKNPNNPSHSRAVSMHKKMMALIHRSIMNNPMNSKCAWWKKTKNGLWYTTSKRRCEAR